MREYPHSRLKLLFVTIMVVFICSSSAQQSDSTYSFADFVRQFNRTYTGAEYAYREGVFNTNVQLIEQLEAQSNGECHFSINNSTDRTQEQRKQRKGYSTQTSRTYSKLPPKLSADAAALGFPASLNYAEIGVVTDVRDQGYCGSCWAFSTVAVYESLLAMETGVHFDLAEQFVLDCTLSGDCDGGYPIDALEVIIENGIPLQSSFPYSQNENTYPGICSPDSFEKLQNPVINTQHYYSVTDDQLKEILSTYGPVSIGLYANSGFDYYSGGVYSGCPSYSATYINHAVLLVGYTENGDWIVKNSWGADWGENGYITINRNADCGLKTYVDVIEADWSGYNFTDGNYTDGDNQDDETIYDDDENATYLQYTVECTDSYGDGWGGITFGIKQNEKWTSTFGAQFLYGYSYGPVTIRVKENIPATIALVAIGSYTGQVGFSIYNEKGELIFTRCSGSSFSSSTIFHTWCPGSQCEAIEMFEVMISMTDSWGDGWNGNILGFKQNGMIVGTFGSQFMDGHELGPKSYSIPIGVSTHVVVYIMGYWRSQIGFTIRDTQGNEILSRQPGATFYANADFGTFCPGCENTANVRIIAVSDQKRALKPITNPLDVNYIPPQQSEAEESVSPDAPAIQTIVHEKTITAPENDNTFIITTAIFGFFTIFFMLTTVGLFILWKNERKEIFRGPSISYQEQRLIDDNIQARDPRKKLSKNRRNIFMDDDEKTHEKMDEADASKDIVNACE